MTVHELKTVPEFFYPLYMGKKTFEVRVNDRNFHVGDCLTLKEYKDGEYTGMAAYRTISYILDDKKYCKDGFVILGFEVP